MKNMLKIVVLDDDSLIISLIETLLKENYEVYLFSDPVKCLLEIRKIKPDILICDWMMPEINGIEFIKIIKDGCSTKNIYTILCTGKTKIEDKVFGLDSGADDYIAKPFSKDLLLEKVKLAEEYIKNNKSNEMKGYLYSLDPIVYILDYNKNIIYLYPEIVLKDIQLEYHLAKQFDSDVNIKILSLIDLVKQSKKPISFEYKQHNQFLDIKISPLNGKHLILMISNITDKKKKLLSKLKLMIEDLQVEMTNGVSNDVA